MRCLVTGGCGFIGSHLVDRLVADGHEVRIVDNLDTGSFHLGLNAECEVESDDAAQVVYEFEPEAVFHLAAQTSVVMSTADPLGDCVANVAGTVNLLSALRKCPPDAFVFTSTGGAIYGDGEPVFNEQDAPAPESPYAQSKLAAEGYISLLARDFPATILRLANVYGPRQDPHGEAGVIAIFSGLVNEGKPVTVFGDGTQTRDYVHVTDVVEALISSVGHPGTFNIGTGLETSVLELAERFGATVEHAPAREGEVERSALDARLAARTFGWYPKIGLDQGIATCLKS